MENSSLFIILQKMRKPFLVIVLTYTIAILGLILIDGVDNNGNAYKMSIFDAFYFVSYMATTIGFGETPYEFTYSQRIWVTFSIYLTVIGWFYGVGSLVSLLQDKLFIQELEKAKFARQIKNLKEKFIIVLSYNEITSEIIKEAIKQGIRPVVIEKDKKRVNDLILESFTPSVPVLHCQDYSIKTLNYAGIKKTNCKAIVSLFEDDAMNLRISLTSKLLNKHIKVVAKSSSKNQSENLRDIEVDVIVNPFSIISEEISMALNSLNTFRLEKWIYGTENLSVSLPKFPKGKYIICGYGRLGRKLYEKLNSPHMDISLIEIDDKKVLSYTKEEMEKITFANADDKEVLLNLEIKQADVIIAATNDDTTNLSIIATAKKLNKNIMTIVRENEMDDFSIFKNANVDHIFMPSRIVINKTINALINPLSDIFIQTILKKDEKWASLLVKDLIVKIDEKPLLLELTINKEETPQIYKYLKKENSLNLEILSKSLRNEESSNNMIPLLLQRDEKNDILPSLQSDLQISDKILIACDANAKDDILYIVSNVYEFYYALNGKEKQRIFKGK